MPSNKFVEKILFQSISLLSIMHKRK